MSDGQAPPPPPDQVDSPDDKGRQDKVRLWIALGAGVVIVILAVALVLALRGGSDDTAGRARPDVPAEYITGVTSPLRRLSDSAEASGRTLARASKAADVVAVGRMADQQLLLVQTLRRKIAAVAVPAAAHAASGALARATQAHRSYLITLTRLPDLDTAKAIASLKVAHKQVNTALAQYRLFGRNAPELVAPITTAGMSDLSGVRNALNDQAKQQAQAGSARTGGRTSGGGSATASPSGPRTSTSGSLTVSSVSGSDLGSTIRLSGSYCDRSPGRVNDFTYTFQITTDDRVVVASDSYSASQTRACNTVSMDFSDDFSTGPFGVTLIVDNLSNNITATGYGSLSVIN